MGDEATGGLVTAQFFSWILTVYLRSLEKIRSRSLAIWRFVVGLVGLFLLGQLAANFLGITTEEFSPQMEWLSDLAYTGLLFLLSTGAVLLGAAALIGKRHSSSCNRDSSAASDW